LRPGRLGQDTRGQIGQVERAGDQEDALNRPVTAFDDEQPHTQGSQRHRDIFAYPEDFHAGGYAGKLADGVGQVGQEQYADNDGAGTYAHTLPDQFGQPFAGNHPQPRAHLLDDDQGQRYQRHHPQQSIAVMRAGYRIRGNAARVVVYVGGDDSRSDDRQQQQQPDPDGLEA
jgi:hypothetical protein